ncbi:Uncharacterized membrane protein [Tistlia consotensis]|uniref:Uncharacterized membrane protein n=1 Tax=Tistlia consotensis USBA 355 TaxID=560819 RepID=A0A1Y6C461_9PROT|nr:DUF2254 domain-containing protein [Tistlia consotensis]SMF44601.1 Uncharacterized membrane protein [Tistlia consotensis USBA 355]SNR43387.1 Uncharacterized membrane protein [Tistlia consotensis]
MSARLKYLHYVVVNSFWFVPTVLLLAAILLAVLSAILDRAMQATWSRELAWVLWVGPDGARTILQVIAGSMIGATSLVFSMTLVSLTLASQQLGPRLLAIFRADRPTQVALGVFVSTLAYALMMLRLIRPQGDSTSDFVPLASVTMAQLLTLFSLAVLIYFIHHLAELLQADTVVAHVGDALDGSVRSLFPATSEPEDGSRQQEEAAGPGPSGRFCLVVPSARTGYVQTIAVAQLVGLAEQSDGRIELQVMAGDFLVPGQAVARFWPLDRATEALKERIRDGLTIGPKRTQAEDLEYAANALVEIALRALSPSLNDPFTAIASIDRIGAALALAIGRADPPLEHRDAAGRLRLTLPSRGFVDLLEGSFDDIRRAGADHPAVLRTLAARLAGLAELAADPERRAAIWRQGEALRRLVGRRLDEPLDRQRVDVELERLDERLARWDG